MRAEAASPRRLARDLQRGAVAIQRVLHDREPQARAAALARAPPVDAIETLGEPRDVLRGDADARVLDIESRPLFRLAPAQRDRTVLRRIPDRVAHEIAEGAGELLLAADEVERRVGSL